ncbi:MAG TPA: hypothetical protein VEX68_07330, partial [Bryobacteraceae bacterium]|nr:hypothetical protein [Bryobacteraceae bacterium]
LTAAKLAANRANAQMSTGPRNTERSRFNGISHGLASKRVVIPGESRDQYEAFRESFFAELNPQSLIEETLVNRIVAAAWRLKRFMGVEDAFYSDRVNAYCEEHPYADPNVALANLFINPAESARLKLILRYQTSVQREYDKATLELNKVRAERAQALIEEAIAETMKPSEQAQAEPAEPVGFASQSAPEPTPRQKAQRRRTFASNLVRRKQPVRYPRISHAGKAVRSQRNRIEVARPLDGGSRSVQAVGGPF